MNRIRALFVSVVPAPYQRDIFAALSRRPEIELQVRYMEAAAPDSPWPERPLASYERVLPGFWIPIGKARCHFNWSLPRITDFDLIVLNTVISFTAQRLIRACAGRRPWIFWGERMRPPGSGRSDAVHARIVTPLHHAAAIVGIGRLAEAGYRRRFPQPLHRNIPYYCELAPFLSAPRRPGQDKTVFLFCGQMIARKGLDLLLWAFAKLVEKNPAVELRLAGREADLFTQLAALPAPARDRIVYEGFHPPENLPRCFSAADVFILPSRYDGWGVVVNQALGAGLPIICSDAVGAAADLVTEGSNGATFPSGDREALWRLMERLAADPQLRQSWGSASRATAAEWAPENGAARWVGLFQELLGRTVSSL